MKTIFIILSSLLLSNILTLKYTHLTMNKVYDVETKGEEFSYFKFSLKNLQMIPNEITIETIILKSEKSSSPIIGVYYEPIKMKNYKHLLKTELGKPITLDSEFIKSALERKSEIYFTVFSKNAQYKVNIIPSGDIKAATNFVQIPVRSLAEENNNTNPDLKSIDNRLAFYSGDGISALIVAFIMVFVSLIGCLIMMNIYVHNTALVEQPLKLGRIEA
ncbi:MAG: hypothetical protein J6N43_06175 [Prevotella sp.]|nr:hypothetical protein [Prevotella sp.]